MKNSWQSTLYWNIRQNYESKSELACRQAVDEREHATSALVAYLSKVLQEGSVDFTNLDFPILDMVARLHISGLILRIAGNENPQWELNHVQDRTFDPGHLTIYINNLILETIPKDLRSDDLHFELPLMGYLNYDRTQDLLHGLTIKSVYE
jgi:hypothetical protein